MKKALYCFTILLLIFGTCFFTYKIFEELIHNNVNNKIKNDLKESVVYVENKNSNLNEDPKDVATSEDKNINVINGPKDIEATKFLDVDFTDSTKINSDVVAWIMIPNTGINYPIVQTTNNDFYLNHNLKKEKNRAGWIFADYRSNFNELGSNTVLYGHNQFDSSMFGDIKKMYKSKDWFKETENNLIYLTTKENSYVFQVVSLYITEPTAYYIKHNFIGNDFYNFIKNINQSNEKLDISSSLGLNDKILTLSTCSGKNRMVLQAKLISTKSN